MLGIGFLEIVVIALVALVALGPKHLPGVLKTIARYYKQFQNLKSELNKEIVTISHMNDVTDTDNSPRKPLPIQSTETKNG